MIDRCILISAAICCTLYCFTGVFGYLSFLELTTDNILTHYPNTAWYFDLGKIGYSLIIIFSYPLLAFPLRDSFDHVVNTYYFKEPNREISTKRRVLEALGIYLVSFGVSVLPIGIGIVFGVTGSIFGTMIVVGLPCAFYIILDIDPRENAPGFRKSWWFYRIFSVRKIVPVTFLLVSLILVITGLLSILAFSVLGGLDAALNGSSQY